MIYIRVSLSSVVNHQSARGVVSFVVFIMFGSIHSNDHVDNDFQARIDQLALTGRPIDRRTMDELGEQVQVRLGLRAGKPEVLRGFVQQLIDSSQQLQHPQQQYPVSSVRPDPTGRSPIRSHNSPARQDGDDDAISVHRADMNEKMSRTAAEIREPLEQCENRVPQSLVPTDHSPRRPLASRTNAPTPNRAPHDDAKASTEPCAAPVFRLPGVTTTSPPHSSLDSVPEPPTTPSSSTRSGVASSNQSDDDSFSSAANPVSHRRGLRDGDEDNEPHQEPLTHERLEQHPRRPEQVEHFSVGTALIQVKRLRDVVEGRVTKYESCDYQEKVFNENSLEAALVTPFDHFPSEFRWEALQTCVQAHDVLWLSSTVFVSTGNFDVEDRDESLHDCSIEFKTWNDHIIGLKLYVYSLSAFLTGERGEPSVLPFQFLQHVTALLPVGYFSSIHLTYLEDGENPRGCPIASILQFFSIVPNGGTHEAAEPKCFTRYVLEGNGTITVEGLQAILSHQFHPSVRLAFEAFPFTDVSVPIIEMLKDAPHLRSVEFPNQLVGEYDDSLQDLPVAFSVRSSNNLTIHTSHWSWEYPGDTASLLVTIAALHDLEDISISCDITYNNVYTVDNLHQLGRCVGPFLDGRLKSKSVRVQLIGDLGLLHKIKEGVAALTVPCKSNDLTMFNVRLSPYLNILTLKGEPEQNVGDVQQWDAEIFPSLVLNYCGKQLMQPLADRILSSAIQSINTGLVYHKTTGHKPVNMNVANAGLIFAVMRIKAGENPDVEGDHL
jgi:hypothetical protein